MAMEPYPMPAAAPLPPEAVTVTVLMGDGAVTTFVAIFDDVRSTICVSEINTASDAIAGEIVTSTARDRPRETLTSAYSLVAKPGAATRTA